MWKFRNAERTSVLKSRIEKLVTEDKKMAFAEIRENRKKVENVIKALDSLLVGVADVDLELWRHVADARKYAKDLKRFLDEKERLLGGEHVRR